MNKTIGIYLSSLLLTTAAHASSKITPLYEILQKKGSYYDITYPRLLAGSPVVLRSVNADIEKSMLISEEPCDDAKGSDYASGVTHVEVRPGLVMSAVVDGGGYCAGAAHPDAYQEGLVYDLATGKRATLQEQFKGADTSSLDAILLKKALADASTTSGDSCGADAYQQLGTTAAGFSIEGTEVRIWTSYPHVAAACDVETTVSLADLSAQLAPGSLLDKIAKLKKSSSP